MDQIIFKETQRFLQKWVWALIILILGIFAYAFVQQIILDKPFGNHPMPNGILILTGLVPIGLLLLFHYTRLETEIRRDGLYYRFFPLHRKFRKIDWQEVRVFGIRKYRPIKEYGGWGIRCSASGKAFNVSGNMGLLLELKNNQKVLFGTQKPRELENAIQHIHREYGITFNPFHER